MTALMGLAGPLALTLLLTGVIAVATIHSGFYTPSITPNVAMALWGHAASSAMPPGMLVAAITMFGAMRFSFRALIDFIPARLLKSSWTLAAAGSLIGTFLCWVIRDSPVIDKSLEFLTNLLAITAAVLTADFLTRSWRLERMRIFDPAGMTALVIGLATPLYFPDWISGAAKDQWGSLWLLLSYITAVLACLLGRTSQRFRLTRATR